MTPPPPFDAESRAEIEAALRSYCRGIDRLDAAAVLAAFHPAAELHDYGADPMTVEAFVEYALPALEKRFTATQHRISNTTIERDGDDGGDDGDDRALVETYVLAFHHQPGDDGAPPRLHTFNGRYVDRFERRAGQWAIARRHLRVDWSRIETVEETMGGAWVASGRAGSPDPVYPDRSADG